MRLSAAFLNASPRQGETSGYNTTNRRKECARLDYSFGMATATTVPMEVYLRSSYVPDAEYVDGSSSRGPMGEYDHAAWQLAILAYFLRRAEWKAKALPELRVQVAPTRFRVPDVTVLDQDAPKAQIIMASSFGGLRKFSLPKTL